MRKKVSTERNRVGEQQSGPKQWRQEGRGKLLGSLWGSYTTRVAHLARRSLVHTASASIL